MIIIREGIQAILLRQPPLRAGDLRGPAELRFLRTPRDRIGRRIAGNFKKRVDFFQHFRCFRVCNIFQRLGNIAHFENLDMNSRLALQQRKIAVHIEHAAVIAAQEAEAASCQIFPDFCRKHPFPNFPPGVKRLRPRRSIFIRKRNCRSLLLPQKAVYEICR